MDDVVTINNNTTQGNPNPPPIRITPYFWRLTSCIAHFVVLMTLIPCLVFMQKDTTAKEACSYLDAWAIAFTVRELLLVLAALMYVLYWDDTRLSGNQTYFIKKIIETQSGLYLATYFFMIFAFGSVTRSSPECKTTFSYKFSLAILVFQIIRMFSWFLFSLFMALSFVFCVQFANTLLTLLGGHQGQSSGFRRPARDAEIAKLADVKYGSSECKTVEFSQTCSICLDDYIRGDILRLLPCGYKHHFHKNCVDPWLRVNAVCPTCRRIVIDTGQGRVGTLAPIVSRIAPDTTVAAATTTTTTTTTAAAAAAAETTTTTTAAAAETTGVPIETTVTVNVNTATDEISSISSVSLSSTSFRTDVSHPALVHDATTSMTLGETSVVEHTDVRINEVRGDR